MVFGNCLLLFLVLLALQFFHTKVLNAVNVVTVARFLPVIFNQLFHILVVTGNEDVSLNVVRYAMKLFVKK